MGTPAYRRGVPVVCLGRSMFVIAAIGHAVTGPAIGAKVSGQRPTNQNSTKPLHPQTKTRNRKPTTENPETHPAQPGHPVPGPGGLHFWGYRCYIGRCYAVRVPPSTSDGPVFMPSNSSSRHLPRPFYDDWPGTEREAAQALWHWHSALAHPQPVGGDGLPGAIDQFFEEETARAERGEPLRLVRESVSTAAYAVCDAYDLDRSDLAAQVRGAQRLEGVVRFDTAAGVKEFIRSWVFPHAHLLAGLHGYGYSWATRKVEELGRGFFHLARLAGLPQDLAEDRLFLPLDELERADVSIRDLRDGNVDEGIRRLLWKQSVRVRDALGQGQPLLRELSLLHRLHAKRWWHAALELLNEIERRNYDVWTEPVRLSGWRRAQVLVQTVFGKASAR